MARKALPHETIIFFYPYTKAKSEYLTPVRRNGRGSPSKPESENSDMKTKAIEFNADDFVGGVEAFARHVAGKEKLTLRTATKALPAPIKPFTPSQVRSIR